MLHSKLELSVEADFNTPRTVVKLSYGQCFGTDRQFDLVTLTGLEFNLNFQPASRAAS